MRYFLNKIRRRSITSFERKMTISTQSSVLTKDGAKISYVLHREDESKKTSPPLLMINGWTCTGEFWGSLMTRETPKERDVVTFDLRGSGQSDVTEGPYDVKMLAEDTKALIDDLDVQGKVHVLGFSLGGMIAQQIAAAHPERVASLVLCSTTAGGKNMVAAEKEVAKTFFGCFRKFDDDESEMKAARTFAEYGLAPKNESSLIDRVARTYLSSSKCTTDGINAQMGALNWKGIKEEESSSEIPVLIVHGTEDKVLPYGNVEGMKSLWSRSRVLELPGHGHFWNATRGDAPGIIASFLQDVDQDGNIQDHYEVVA